MNECQRLLPLLLKKSTCRLYVRRRGFGTKICCMNGTKSDNNVFKQRVSKYVFLENKRWYFGLILSYHTRNINAKDCMFILFVCLLLLHDKTVNGGLDWKLVWSSLGSGDRIQDIKLFIHGKNGITRTKSRAEAIKQNFTTIYHSRKLFHNVDLWCTRPLFHLYIFERRIYQSVRFVFSEKCHLSQLLH